MFAAGWGLVKDAGGNLQDSEQVVGEHASGAKAPVSSVGFMYGLKPVPFDRSKAFYRSRAFSNKFEISMVVQEVVCD